MNFIKSNDIREVLAPVSAGSSIDSNSDIIDTSGYSGVTFITPITDSAATGVATMTIEQNTANSDTGMTALSGATATATCAVNDDLNGKLLIVEIDAPQERYVQAVLTSATANIAYGNTVAILHGAKKLPVSEHSTVSDATLVVSPDEA